ncbi:MAG: hypothetical protein C4567_02365 [Deltaproteobacteria bacterium]|nr:MAG: hypothetical protein C4567_02365 [Deltaproteobacteria bacterium]
MDALAGDRETAAPQILIEGRAGNVKLILNRPRVLNTLTPEMIQGLKQGFDAARAAAGCRLVLLRGAGERGFCAGGDLKALARLVQEQSWDRAMEFFEQYCPILRQGIAPGPLILVREYIHDLRIFSFYPVPPTKKIQGVTDLDRGPFFFLYHASPIAPRIRCERCAERDRRVGRPKPRSRP